MKTIPIPFYLTKSRVRADLLTLFFLNPGRSYYLRELERRFGASPGTLSRELKNFADQGILLRSPRGKEIFYCVHTAYPLFQEIKSMIEKTAGVPKRLSEGLRKRKEIRSAYLYGSFACGKMDAGSDIDLLLVGKETAAVRKLVKMLERKFDRSINFTVYPVEEFERKRRDVSEFLHEVMHSPLIQLKSSISDDHHPTLQR